MRGAHVVFRRSYKESVQPSAIRIIGWAPSATFSGARPYTVAVENREEVFDAYHRWYYEKPVWITTKFLGVPCLKSVCDLWNYQEILAELKPRIVVEFGTNEGGSTLYFAEIMKLIDPLSTVLSVDIDHSHVADVIRLHPHIELLTADTTSECVAERVRALRYAFPERPAFFILDSDHSKAHVVRELQQLRAITRPGDYVIVEDGNINGHPVLPGWGEGPWEALDQYIAEHPDDYEPDLSRETKFGWTFAPRGFLIRR
jgi:cephalosporin hydroxylase